MSKEKSQLIISISDQTLKWFENGTPVKTYSISSAKNGVGEIMGSECTPRGKHTISDKYGDGCVMNTVFVARQTTSEIYKPALRKAHSGRDWILTRIIWLSGEEVGRNQGGQVDSHARYIYIHGSPDDVKMGKPGSRGCIRMRNADIVELYDAVSVGTEVIINE